MCCPPCFKQSTEIHRTGSRQLTNGDQSRPGMSFMLFQGAHTLLNYSCSPLYAVIWQYAERRMYKAFDRFDLDEDGIISFDEFEIICQEIMPELTAVKIKVYMCLICVELSCHSI